MFWYEQDIKGLEAIKSTIKEQPKLVFYGSSSIRLWKNIGNDFSQYHPVNLGFGGSTLAACIWYFDRVMANLSPEGIVLYAGDNDLGDGRHPEEVLIFFKQLMTDIRIKFGSIPVAFISIKPSIKRFNIIKQIAFTNQLIAKEIDGRGDATYFINIFDVMLDHNHYPKRDLFEAEGLHINENGYALWKQILTETFLTNGFHLAEK